MILIITMAKPKNFPCSKGERYLLKLLNSVHVLFESRKVVILKIETLEREVYGVINCKGGGVEKHDGIC